MDVLVFVQKTKTKAFFNSIIKNQLKMKNTKTVCIALLALLALFMSVPVFAQNAYSGPSDPPIPIWSDPLIPEL